MSRVTIERVYVRRRSCGTSTARSILSTVRAGTLNRYNTRVYPSECPKNEKLWQRVSGFGEMPIPDWRSARPKALLKCRIQAPINVPPGPGLTVDHDCRDEGRELLTFLHQTPLFNFIQRNATKKRSCRAS